MTEAMESDGPVRVSSKSSHRRTLVAVAVVVIGGALAVVAVRGGPEEDPASSGEDAAGIVTAPVEQRVLESLQVTRGSVIAPSQVTVLGPEAGEGERAVVVTALPQARGAAVKAGAVVVELNGRPVLALPGAIPLFRDIRPGHSGPDVEALQAALAAMGVSIPESEHAVFGKRTQAAVERLYDDAGYEPRYTLGSEDAVDDAVAQATAGLDEAEAALDQARAQGAPNVASLEEAASAARAARRNVIASEGLLFPMQEILAVPVLPAVVVDLPVSVGQRVQAQAPVVSLGSSKFQVRIELTSAQVSELAPNLAIAVSSDRGYEATCAPGEARQADAPADEGSAPPGDGATGDGSSGGQPAPEADAFEMTVSCDPAPPADGLGSSLRVTLTVPRSDGPVLVVPVTAVTTTAEGATYVEVVDDQNQSARVEVTVGGEADGFVAVEAVGSPDALSEGMDVRVRRD